MIALSQLLKRRGSLVRNMTQAFRRGLLSFACGRRAFGPLTSIMLCTMRIHFLKLARILWASRHADTETFKPYLWSALSSWMQKRKLEVRHRLAEHLGLPRQKIVTLLHHESHAASAFFCSPFERSTIVTLDGVGEFETASVSLGSGIDIQRLQSIHLPHSLGLFYTAFTAYLGFEVNEGEYKVMGMAAFGQPIFYNEVRQLVALHSDGSFTIDQNYFNF